MKNFIGSAYEHSSKGTNPTQFQLTAYTVGYGVGLVGISIIVGVTLVGVTLSVV